MAFTLWSRGHTAQVRERVAAFAEAGADLLLLPCSPQLEEMERFGAEVIRGRAALTSANELQTTR